MSKQNLECFRKLRPRFGTKHSRRRVSNVQSSTRVLGKHYLAAPYFEVLDLFKFFQRCSENLHQIHRLTPKFNGKIFTYLNPAKTLRTQKEKMSKIWNKEIKQATHKLLQLTCCIPYLQLHSLSLDLNSSTRTIISIFKFLHNSLWETKLLTGGTVSRYGFGFWGQF
jgi:hypothetical protein